MTKDVILLPEEQILLRRLQQDQGKLLPCWQPTPFVAIKQWNPALPMYKV